MTRKTQSWYYLRDLMKRLGHSKNRARTIAWTMQPLAHGLHIERVITIDEAIKILEDVRL